MSKFSSGATACVRPLGLVSLVLALSGNHRAIAQQEPDSGAPVSYSREVRPILADRCFHCHGRDADRRKAKLRLDQPDGVAGAYRVRKGKAAIRPGSLAESALWRRVTSTDPKQVMPPPSSHKRALDEAELRVIRRWILEGAEYEQHWAFSAPAQPRVPELVDDSWTRGAVDRFVLRRAREAGLDPSPPADRRTLIRRLSIDLTGLPPTLEEIREFLADESADAYGRLVDRLLAKPQHGEHMARYWLDLVRFADTNGIHHDHYREASPYRDWVIRSFRDNVPFDEFVVDQVAGDLHDEPNTDQLIASGFHRLHLIIDVGTALPEESLVRNVIDRVSAVGTAFLGLTLGCAVCHDHKYDPIPQLDFYRLSAFFNNLDGKPETGGRRGSDFRRGLQPPFINLPSPEQAEELGKREAELAVAREVTEFLKQKSKALEDRSQRAQDTVTAESSPPEASEPAGGKLSASKTDPSATVARDAAPVVAQVAADGTERGADLVKAAAEGETGEVATNAEAPIAVESSGGASAEAAKDGKKARKAALDAELARNKKRVKELADRRDKVLLDVPGAMVMRERAEARSTHVLVRGAYDNPGDEVQRGTPAFLPPLPRGAADRPTRMDFARWLVDPKHPLTARVAVNRFWQQIFGVGLVKTAEDFGLQGEAPSHPDLLDHLAVSFVESGWDVRALLRRIVMSATYRQSSQAAPEVFVRDPENRWLARGSRYRMDAEVVRDQILATSGLLNPTMFGKSVKPPQPAGIWKAVNLPSSFPRVFQADEGDKIYRRSIYTFWKRGLPPPQMTLLNAPTREFCKARRERTNTPLQALLLWNEPEYLKAARHLAHQTLIGDAGTSGARLRRIYETITSQLPDPNETMALLDGLVELLSEYAEQPDLASALCDGVELGDGVSAVELAAWTSLTSTIYHLDITKTRQ